MSSGKIHKKATTGLALLSTPLLLWCAVNVREAIIFIIPGILLGILITPDLDIDHRIVSHRVMRNVFGRIFGYYWYYLWHSYSIAFTHRSMWSHAPFIGTLVRLTFLVFPPIIVLFRNQQTSLSKFATYLLISTLLALPIAGALFVLVFVLQLNIIFFVFAVLGLMLADALHFIMDII